MFSQKLPITTSFNTLVFCVAAYNLHQYFVTACRFMIIVYCHISFLSGVIYTNWYYIIFRSQILCCLQLTCSCVVVMNCIMQMKSTPFIFCFSSGSSVSRLSALRNSPGVKRRVLQFCHIQTHSSDTRGKSSTGSGRMLRIPSRDPAETVSEKTVNTMNPACATQTTILDNLIIIFHFNYLLSVFYWYA